MKNHFPLRFPATRKALWCHQYIGDSFISVLPRVSLSVTEQVLYLAYGQSRSGKVESCSLCGELKLEPDCSEIVLFLDQFQPGCSDTLIASSSGDVNIPTQLRKSSRHVTDTGVDGAFIKRSYMDICDHTLHGGRIELSDFLAATAKCTVFSGSNQIHCDLEVDVLLPTSEFSLTPIESVCIGMTALSKSVLGQDKHGLVSSQIKFGYLTMDQYRKVIFLMESDPKIATIPIIGIWVSGVDLITDPHMWACCMRYLHTSKINDRVCKPSEPFLLIHKSPLMSKPQFFDCKPGSMALNFKLLSGCHGFSMEKETDSKRKGLLSMKLDVQDVSSSKRLIFNQVIEEILRDLDKENGLMEPAKVTKQKADYDNLDDSLPRASPFPYKSQVLRVGPTVPEVSLLDDSMPIVVPHPERHVLQQVNDCRLNTTPDAKQPTSQPRHDNKHKDPTTRKICFDEAGEIIKRTPMAHPIVKSGTPSLRSPNTMNINRSTKSKHKNVEPQSRHIQTREHNSRDYSLPMDHPKTQFPVTSVYINPDNQAEPNNLQQSSQSISPNPCLPQTDNHSQITKPAVYHHQPVEPFQQPYPPCSCQLRYSKPHPTSYEPTRVAPLSVITDNVMRLLSPKANGQSTKDGYEQVTISPIENVNAGYQVFSTPSPLPRHSQPSNAVSPEVQQILQNQDQQLKSLQQQIEKLLASQKTRTSGDQFSHCAETQTAPTKKSIEVNTGRSLLEYASPNNASTNDSQDTENDSSQSHSLIQHDLTHLDLPTQVTARSFASDINVDYSSYDGSPTGSPKCEDGSSQSDTSWQSPVLGESVSMLAESAHQQQQSTKQQLDMIVKNVRDLLSRHTPQLPLDHSFSEHAEDVDISCGEHKPVSCNIESETCLGDKTTDQIPLTAAGVTESVETEIRAEDVALATRNQLRQLGVEMTPPTPSTSGQSACLPKVQYISMMLSDSILSDPNKSVELNALALKYLQDDQLAQLAQYAVQKNKHKNQTSLLRHVLTLNKADQSVSSIAETFDGRNMSMATQEYLKRYALHEMDSTNDQTATNDIVQATPPAPNAMPPALNSIRENTSDAEDDDSTIQVLDITRLKELPKLL